jgi:membrane-bound serine protease (ClpP class)
MSSLVLALYFSGIIPAEQAVMFLYIVGVVLIIAELGVVSLGVFALNGALAIYAAYSIQTGSLAFLGLPLDWGIFFGVATVEFFTVTTGIYIWIKLKQKKTETGTEGMIGRTARIITWSGREGTVRFEGERWLARSDQEMEIAENERVKIAAVERMTLVITA